MKKRFLSCLLTMAMLISMMPSVFASDIIVVSDEPEIISEVPAETTTPSDNNEQDIILADDFAMQPMTVNAADPVSYVSRTWDAQQNKVVEKTEQATTYKVVDSTTTAFAEDGDGSLQASPAQPH